MSDDFASEMRDEMRRTGMSIFSDDSPRIPLGRRSAFSDTTIRRLVKGAMHLTLQSLVPKLNEHVEQLQIECNEATRIQESNGDLNPARDACVSTVEKMQAALMGNMWFGPLTDPESIPLLSAMQDTEDGAFSSTSAEVQACQSLVQSVAARADPNIWEVFLPVCLYSVALDSARKRLTSLPLGDGAEASETSPESAPDETEWGIAAPGWINSICTVI